MTKPLLKLEGPPRIQGEEVVALQRLLVLFGTRGNPVTTDGTFGPGTEAALKRAQKHFGLPETGETDEATWDALHGWLEERRERFETLLAAYKCNHAKASPADTEKCDDLWADHVQGKIKLADDSLAGPATTCAGFGSGLQSAVETVKKTYQFKTIQSQWIEHDGIDAQLALYALWIMDLYGVDGLNVHDGYRCNWSFFRIRKIYGGSFSNHAGCGLDFHIDGSRVLRPGGSVLPSYASDQVGHCNAIRDDLVARGVSETFNTSPHGPRTEPREDSSNWVHIDTTVMSNHRFVKTFDELLEAAGAAPGVAVPTAVDFVKAYGSLEKDATGGFFPLGANLCWHGGVHLPAAADDPIGAAFSGTVVAARLAPVPETGDGPQGGRNFVLVRHTVRQKPVFSLYMHLAVHSLDLEDPWLKKATWIPRRTAPAYRHVGMEKKAQRNLRKTAGSTSAKDVAGTLKYGEVAEFVADSDLPNWKKVKLPNGKVGFMMVDTPDLRWEEAPLEQLRAGRVVALDVPVRAGQFLWGAGTLGAESTGIHFEIFSEHNIVADESRLARFAPDNPLRRPESHPKGWKSGETLKVVAVHKAPAVVAVGEELPLEVWQLSHGDALSSEQGKISWEIKLQKDREPEVHLETLQGKGPCLRYKVPEAAKGMTLIARPYVKTPQASLAVRTRVAESVWHACSDPDADLNVDSAEINAALGGIIADGELTSDELVDFFHSNPEGRADLLRGYVCSFTSEWALPDPKAVVENLSRRGLDIAESDLLPYQWWNEARAAGVALPTDPKVWHYHPVRFLEMLPHLSASKTELGRKILAIEGPKGASPGVWTDFDAVRFADGVTAAEMARVQWSSTIGGKTTNATTKGKGLRYKFQPEHLGLVAEIRAWIDKPEDGCAISVPIGPCLRFDGQNLAWLDEAHKEVKVWKGVSGLPGFQTGDHQKEKDKGPIPEGLWHLRKGQVQHYDDLDWMQQAASGVDRGQWPGGTARWGNHRAWLEPATGTNSHGRSNFCIHGGKEAGSAGCIDLTDKMDDFNTFLAGQPKDLVLRVGYSVDAASNVPTGGLMVISHKALIRDPTMAYADTGNIIPFGNLVEILAVDKKYARVRIKETRAEAWTALSNLAEFFLHDANLRTMDQKPNRHLIIDPKWSAQKKSIANVYNRVGGILDAVATRNEIDAACALAVWAVESGGAAHVPGKAIIRFENHLFYRTWGANNKQKFDEFFKFNEGSEEWTGHKYRKTSSEAWTGFHGNQDSEYAVLSHARSLSDSLALEATSIGGCQIVMVGYAQCGYASSLKMYEAFQKDERFHVLGFFDFCNYKLGFDENKKGILLKKMRNKDWSEVARLYNGPGQISVYAPLFEAAYNSAVELF